MKPPLVSPTEFADGLGVRAIIAQKNGEALELFRIRPELCSNPDFELALRERVSRLANFRQAFFARVRRIEREGSGLGIVSEHTAGARLSHVLDVAERYGLDLDVNAALCLLRQLVPAVATLHQNAREVSHGAIAPERILVTSHARIVITRIRPRIGHRAARVLPQATLAQACSGNPLPAGAGPHGITAPT